MTGASRPAGDRPALAARIVTSAHDIAPAAWDRLAGNDNPFTSHAFLSALEDSGSAVTNRGWQPTHIVIDDAQGEPAGILPGYLKSHSQGEYVFDHGWAEAWEHAGQSYYPKLQHATPFTPATAPKLLATDPHVRAGLISASATIAANNQLSSAHALFLNAADAADFDHAGWLRRNDIQFHWFNDHHTGFDDFLSAMPSRKRKVLRRERAAALAAVDDIVWLTGSDLDEAAWDSFWIFYQDTGSRKWGRPYLTREFFSLLGARMADRIILVMARKNGRYVAGALNFRGADCLFGRQWGCIEDIPFLHFELCYHQAIDIACHYGLARVEAGAQGEHKLARGYRPVITTSAHFLPNHGFRAAVADFLDRERPLVNRRARDLESFLPFRRD